jgi:mycoredoxin
MSDVILYSTPWCGYCRRLKRQLGESGVGFEEIDIDQESHHGDRIEAQTGGFRTVPTVEVGDRLLVNPTVGEVLEAISA